jgi:hypothetical protein
MAANESAVTITLPPGVEYTTTAELYERFQTWRDQLGRPLARAAGDHFTYSYTPTSVGLKLVVTDLNSGKDFDLTPYALL